MDDRPVVTAFSEFPAQDEEAVLTAQRIQTIMAAVEMLSLHWSVSVVALEQSRDRPGCRRSPAHPKERRGRRLAAPSEIYSRRQMLRHVQCRSTPKEEYMAEWRNFKGGDTAIHPIW
jgi:hypothetical protein